jgi:hypothetical protein
MSRLLVIVMGTTLLVSSGMTAVRPHELSKKEVKALLAKAGTPADHLRLAGHFQALANRLESEAQEHAALAKVYRARPTGSEIKRPMSPDTAAHCEYFAESLEKASKAARALAEAHEQMAVK